MTGHANPQRLVDAAVGVRKLDVEYVDSVAECHKLFATGRYAGIPASISIEREPDPLTAGVAQDQEAGLSSTRMVSSQRVQRRRSEPCPARRPHSARAGMG